MTVGDQLWHSFTVIRFSSKSSIYYKSQMLEGSNKQLKQTVRIHSTLLIKICMMAGGISDGCLQVWRKIGIQNNPGNKLS